MRVSRISQEWDRHATLAPLEPLRKDQESGCEALLRPTERTPSRERSAALGSASALSGARRHMGRVAPLSCRIPRESARIHRRRVGRAGRRRAPQFFRSPERIGGFCARDHATATAAATRRRGSSGWEYPRPEGLTAP